MGILSFIFGLRDEPKRLSESEKHTLVTGNPLAVPKTAEQERKAETGRRLKGADLEAAGVNVKRFTPTKLRKDACRIVGEFGSFRIDTSMKQAGYLLDPANLTRAGKVPKCVMTARIHYELPNGRLLACHGMKYKADGTLYSMDFNEWVGHVNTAYSVRERNGKMTLTFKSVEDTEDGHIKVLYREER